MPKLSAPVPQKLLNVIGKVRINEKISKGVANEYLLHLARLKPDIEVMDFNGAAEGTCNLGLKNEQMTIFDKFRTEHDPVLDRNGHFFETALKIGATAYEQGFRLSDKKAFDGAALIVP